MFDNFLVFFVIAALAWVYDRHMRSMLKAEADKQAGNLQGMQLSAALKQLELEVRERKHAEKLLADAERRQREMVEVNSLPFYPKSDADEARYERSMARPRSDEFDNVPGLGGLS